jgi:hypothetical protein
MCADRFEIPSCRPIFSSDSPCSSRARDCRPCLGPLAVRVWRGGPRWNGLVAGVGPMRRREAIADRATNQLAIQDPLISLRDDAWQVVLLEPPISALLIGQRAGGDSGASNLGAQGPAVQFSSSQSFLRDQTWCSFRCAQSKTPGRN